MNIEQKALAEAARHVEKALNELNKAFDVEGLSQQVHDRLTEQAIQLNKAHDEITVNLTEE